MASISETSRNFFLGEKNRNRPELSNLVDFYLVPGWEVKLSCEPSSMITVGEYTIVSRDKRKNKLEFVDGNGGRHSFILPKFILTEHQDLWEAAWGHSARDPRTKEKVCVPYIFDNIEDPLLRDVGRKLSNEYRGLHYIYIANFGTSSKDGRTAYLRHPSFLFNPTNKKDQTAATVLITDDESVGWIRMKTEINGVFVSPDKWEVVGNYKGNSDNDPQETGVIVDRTAGCVTVLGDFRAVADQDMIVVKHPSFESEVVKSAGNAVCAMKTCGTDRIEVYYIRNTDGDPAAKLRLKRFTVNNRGERTETEDGKELDFLSARDIVSSISLFPFQNSKKSYLNGLMLISLADSFILIDTKTRTQIFRSPSGYRHAQFDFSGDIRVLDSHKILRLFRASGLQLEATVDQLQQEASEIAFQTELSALVSDVGAGTEADSRFESGLEILRGQMTRMYSPAVATSQLFAFFINASENPESAPRIAGQALAIIHRAMQSLVTNERAQELLGRPLNEENLRFVFFNALAPFEEILRKDNKRK